MASSSSSSSSSHRSSSHSSSISSSSTSSLLPVMSTDFTPFPSASSSPGGFPSGGDNSGGGGGGPSLASSASLYRTSPIHSSHPPTPSTFRNPNLVLFQTQELTVRPFNEIAVYTFLATLVLLLSVSAAIVVRSFLLRRRHRRMVEEAIRNGTWVPPSPTNGRGGARVDLSKKPKMWEAYLDLAHQTQGLHGQQHFQQRQALMSMMDERDWESMKPVMATYIYDSTQKSSSSQNGGAGTGVTGGGPRAEGQDEDNFQQQRGSARQLFRGFASRLGRAINPTPSGPQFGESNSANNSQRGSRTNLTGQQDVQMTEIGGLSNNPSKVRVAVLIAMPHPHHSSSSTSTSSTSSPSTSRSASSSGPAPQLISALEEEEELPHIEMGVAELVLADSLGSLDESSGGHDHLHHHHDGKGKLRESVASMGSV